MKAKTVKEVLIATRWIVDNVGWHQDQAYLPKSGKYLWFDIDPNQQNKCVNISAVGSCCLWGAIQLVEIEPSIIDPIMVDVNGSIRKAIGGSMTRWNDQSGRTKQEVLDMLDRVIAEAT